MREQEHYVLQVEHLSVVFSGREVLRDVNFDLRRGEMLGVIGTNGAGKTTLIRAIVGLIEPSDGRVLIDGVERTRQRSAIGYVPQKLAFDPEIPLRARDVVALGIDGDRIGFRRQSRSSRRRIVSSLLEAVDATSFADKRIGRLSGGEQQRILIAHALAGESKFIVLDEPLANLDIASERGVVDLLSRIARERNKAILISTHDMNPLTDSMDRILYLAGGTAVCGTADEVIRPEVLSALYGHHVDVLKIHDRIIVVAGATPGPDSPMILHGDGDSRGDTPT